MVRCQADTLRLDCWARIQFRRVHFWVFSMPRFTPPVLSLDGYKNVTWFTGGRIWPPLVKNVTWFMGAPTDLFWLKIVMWITGDHKWPPLKKCNYSRTKNMWAYPCPFTRVLLRFVSLCHNIQFFLILIRKTRSIDNSFNTYTVNNSKFFFPLSLKWCFVLFAFLHVRI